MYAKIARSVVIISIAVFGAACAGSTTNDAGAGDAQDITADASAVQACGASFNAANQHYTTAVNAAKARLAGKACDGDLLPSPFFDIFGTRSSIADEAAAAVLTCKAFENVIKTSPFADPIRKTLADSLTLKALTGELLVLRDSPFQNWSGVERLLPGMTMSTAPEDAGDMASIEFGANGAATYVVTALGAPKFEDLVTTKTSVTYQVDETGGDKDPRTVTVTGQDGKSGKFRLGVQALETSPALPQGNPLAAPIFTLTPVSGDLAAFNFFGKTYVSIFRECDL